MDVEQFLLRLGIRTYVYPVITQAEAKSEYMLGDSLSTELGWIYGINTEINGVLPLDQTTNLPTFGNVGDLYLTLLNGQTMYINQYRMSNLVFSDPAQATTGFTNQKKYMPVNIPLTTDLKQSKIINPKSLTGFSTLINFYYIPRKTYEALVKDGTIKQMDLGIV